MTVNEFIDNYQTAPDEIVLSALGVSNFLAVSVAVLETMRRNLTGQEYIDALNKIKNREDMFWKPYRVGDLATAAYYLLTGETYTGNNSEVLYLMANGMQTGKTPKAS